MKVDNPRFGTGIYSLPCDDCPFDVFKICGLVCPHLGCPTKETYANDCAIAEKAAK